MRINKLKDSNIRKKTNKTKVISADLLDFYFDLEDIFIQIDEEKKFGNKKLVKKKVW